MEYSYRPRDPRGKLREVVTKWTASMRVAGHAPNRGVVFGRDAPPEEEPRAQGWLLDDRRRRTAVRIAARAESRGANGERATALI